MIFICLIITATILYTHTQITARISGMIATRYIYNTYFPLDNFTYTERFKYKFDISGEWLFKSEWFIQALKLLRKCCWPFMLFFFPVINWCSYASKRVRFCQFGYCVWIGLVNEAKYGVTVHSNTSLYHRDFEKLPTYRVEFTYICSMSNVHTHLE